jgi:hypothetical protein
MELKKIALAAAFVAATVGGGAVGASLLGTANAATSTTTPSTAPSGPSGSTDSDHHGGGPGGSSPVRTDEKAVTSAQDATMRAAALQAVPGGTVIRIESDSGDGAYEAHRKKSDGTLMTVKFDNNLAVLKVETGMGQGDPQGHH